MNASWILHSVQIKKIRSACLSASLRLNRLEVIWAISQSTITPEEYDPDDVMFEDILTQDLLSQSPDGRFSSHSHSFIDSDTSVLNS